MNPELIKAAANYAADPTEKTARRFFFQKFLAMGLEEIDAVDGAAHSARLTAKRYEGREEQWGDDAPELVEMELRRM